MLLVFVVTVGCDEGGSREPIIDTHTDRQPAVVDQQPQITQQPVTNQPTASSVRNAAQSPAREQAFQDLRKYLEIHRDNMAETRWVTDSLSNTRQQRTIIDNIKLDDQGWTWHQRDVASWHGEEREINENTYGYSFDWVKSVVKFPPRDSSGYWYVVPTNMENPPSNLAPNFLPGAYLLFKHQYEADACSRAILILSGR